MCITNWIYCKNRTNTTSWPRWPRRPSFAHSFICRASARAKQKRHMQFIYSHSPATPRTAALRAGQRQLKRCRWRLIGFMPHLCVGANSWNCGKTMCAWLVLKIRQQHNEQGSRKRGQLGRWWAWQAKQQTQCVPRREQLQVVAKQLSRTLNEITRKLSDATFWRDQPRGGWEREYMVWPRGGRRVLACFRQASGISIAVAAHSHSHAGNLRHNELHKLTQIKDTSK